LPSQTVSGFSFRGEHSADLSSCTELEQVCQFLSKVQVFGKIQGFWKRASFWENADFQKSASF
jgi:hypothetical protein